MKHSALKCSYIGSSRVMLTNTRPKYYSLLDHHHKNSIRCKGEFLRSSASSPWSISVTPTRSGHPGSTTPWLLDLQVTYPLENTVGNTRVPGYARRFVPFINPRVPTRPIVLHRSHPLAYELHVGDTMKVPCLTGKSARVVAPIINGGATQSGTGWADGPGR